MVKLSYTEHLPGEGRPEGQPSGEKRPGEDSTCIGDAPGAYIVPGLKRKLRTENINRLILITSVQFLPEIYTLFFARASECLMLVQTC